MRQFTVLICDNHSVSKVACFYFLFKSIDFKKINGALFAEFLCVLLLLLFV